MDAISGLALWLFQVSCWSTTTDGFRPSSERMAMSEAEIIEAAVKEIAKWGARRVLTNNDPVTATSPERAYRLNSSEPDIIFIRNDGWTLGTKKEWEAEARALWEDMWVAVIIRPGVRAISYLDYKGLNLP